MFFSSLICVHLRVGWWLCTERRFTCQHLSGYGKWALWSVLSVIQSCLWRFPFLLSTSRRWDHRTSLHRWQPRLKVSRSSGAYRLLARCEILPRMLFLLVPDPLLPREMGCHQWQRRKSLQFGVLLSSSFFSGCFEPLKSDTPWFNSPSWLPHEHIRKPI